MRLQTFSSHCSFIYLPFSITTSRLLTAVHIVHHPSSTIDPPSSTILLPSPPYRFPPTSNGAFNHCTRRYLTSLLPLLGSPESSRRSFPTNTSSSSPSVESCPNPSETPPSRQSRSVPDPVPSPPFTRRCWRIWCGLARLSGRGRGLRLMEGN